MWTVSALRRAVAATAVLAALAPTLASAVEVTGLYKAETLVTGTEEPERTRGFRIGLEEVVIKLTGDAGLAGSPRLASYLARVHDMVTAYEYEDRMKGLPVQDEQGTRERPHFLRMTFDRVQIDALLADLGLTKWSAQRPRLAIWLAVRDARRRYVLTRDGPHGYGQREVLKSASRRRGVPIALADVQTLAAVRLGYGDVERANRNKLAAATRALGAEGQLFGTLTIDAEALYWDVRWTLDCQGRRAKWSAQDVSFDRALHGGLERAAKALSAPM